MRSQFTMKRLGKMKQTRVYEVPECELLELKLDKGLLDYQSQGEATSVEKPYMISGSWD